MPGSEGAGPEELDRRRCLELLGSVPVGRIGVSVRALPVILPVNFVMAGEDVVFRTIPGTKLDAAAAGAVVAFEVDSYARDGSWGWSVLIQGRCSEITDPREMEIVQALPLRAWAFRGGIAERFVRIETTFVSGRRFRRSPT